MGVEPLNRRGRGRGRDAHRDTSRWLKPSTTSVDDLPALDRIEPYVCPRSCEAHTGTMTTFDAGRGCPYQCSFCKIKTCAGPQVAHTNASDIEHTSSETWPRNPPLLNTEKCARKQGLGRDFRPAERAAGARRRTFGFLFS